MKQKHIPEEPPGDILVVDDTLENLRTIEALLKEQGYKVRCVPEPKTALTVADNQPPELMLLDVLMPGMNGYEVCRALKARPETAGFPIIFCTALTETKDLVEGFEAGGVDFLSKPVQPEELLARVKTHLSLRRMQQHIEAQNTQLQQANDQLAREIAERQQAERELTRNEQRLQALFTLSNSKFSSERELVEQAVEDIVRLTDSRIGYLHFVDQQQQTIHLFAWSQEALKHCVAEKIPHYPLEEAGIWADCVRERKPVIHNDYANLAAKQGLPDGHPPLSRHMSVPVFDGEQLCAVAGVGNKAQPYSELDARQLMLFVRSAWEIVQRRNAEERLRKLSRAVEQSANAIVITDLDGAIEFVNPAFTRMSGYSPEDVLGENPRLLKSGKHPPELYQTLWETITGGEIWQGELVNKKKNGDLYWELITISPITDHEGNTTHFVAVKDDITRRKQAEEALQRNERRLHALYALSELTFPTRHEFIQHAVEEIAILTDSQIAYLHFVNIDQESIDLGVWTQATLQNCTAVKDSHYPLSEAGVWADCVRERKPVIHNDYLNLPNRRGVPEGHFPVLRHMSVPIFDGDKICAIAGVGNKTEPYDEADVLQLTLFVRSMWEIIQRRKAEEDLQHAKETAEAANRAKSEFLANMSHEIRTPMNAILGFTDVLHTLITDEQQKSHLDAIHSSGKNLLALINDILDLSKIEAGKLELHYEPVNLLKLGEELRSIFSLQIAQKPLEFRVEIADDIPEYQLLDEVRLRQILFNLVGNAVKFTEKGDIRLSAHALPTPTPSQEGNLSSPQEQVFPSWEGVGVGQGVLDLIITVEDTGIGIPAESQKTIFDAFKQQDNQSTRTYGGTGLGLAITKRLVEMMNGTITLSSEPNKGSRFDITFCGVSVAETIQPPEKEEPFDSDRIIFEPATILVVDDVESNRKLVNAYLQDLSFQVIEAKNGKEAVLLAEQYMPDLILMDLRMPVMDGYEAIQNIRNSTSDIRNVPIIALTASAMKHEKERIIATESGFNGYLRKPFERTRLLHELARFLRYSTQAPVETDTAETREKFETLSPDTLALLPDILDRLEHELMQRYETVRKNEMFDEIEDFARQIKELGERYSLTPLEQFGNELLIHVSHFDIDRLEAGLDAYPQLIERLKLMVDGGAT